MKAPDVRGPQDLPKLRLYLLDLWGKNGPLDSVSGSGAPFTLPGQVSNTVWEQDPYGRTWGEWERHQLANADLWWVSADMVDLTQAVSHSIPEEVRPTDINIPSNSGLVVFERPWIGTDARNPDKQIFVAAVLWGRTRLGRLPGRKEDSVEAVSFSCYEYLPEWVNMQGGTADDAALRMDQVRRYLDTGGHIESVIFNGEHFQGRDAVQRLREGIGNLTDEVASEMAHIRIGGGSNWLPLGRSDWPNNDKLVDPITDGLSLPDDLRGEFANIHEESFQEDRRIMSAFWTLVQTPKIADSPTVRAPRPERRKYERAGHDARLTDVRVVQLRKVIRDAPETPVEGHKKVEWSCQWPVTAHPKMQPYGPGRSLRKLIIVGPFLKGPPDKPLRVRQEVKAFIR